MNVSKDDNNNQSFFHRHKRVLLTTLAIAAIAIIAIVVAFEVTQGNSPGKNGGGKNGGKKIPKITPPVKASLPPEFQQSKKRTILASDIQSRFFNPSGGPSNVLDILSAVDSRLQGVDTTKPCFSNTATSFTFNFATGRADPSVPFYAQCSDQWNGNSGENGWDQYAIVDNSYYVMTRSPAGVVAAKLDVSSPNNTVVLVTVWLSVGLANDGGSHGIMQIIAHPVELTYEMTCAGAGLGYCGVQFKNDDTSLFVTGSNDGEPCGTVDVACFDSTDISTPATNCTLSSADFELVPLGRQAYGNNTASFYPGGSANDVVLKITGSDDVNFGPAQPVV